MISRFGFLEASYSVIDLKLSPSISYRPILYTENDTFAIITVIEIQLLSNKYREEIQLYGYWRFIDDQFALVQINLTLRLNGFRNQTKLFFYVFHWLNKVQSLIQIQILTDKCYDDEAECGFARWNCICWNNLLGNRSAISKI